MHKLKKKYAKSLTTLVQISNWLIIQKTIKYIKSYMNFSQISSINFHTYTHWIHVLQCTLTMINAETHNLHPDTQL